MVTLPDKSLFTELAFAIQPFYFLWDGQYHAMTLEERSIYFIIITIIYFVIMNSI